ncbi:uncharacterized protein [Haliotis cracherodii]|uniref:uncharacterized protein n=1 Tax=Haliotis cracherodii TaxID=6455 RepID=UPI0039EA0B18
MMDCTFSLCLLACVELASAYPITASWFRDRYTIRDWNTTLSQFKAIGGDTVWQRAPTIIRRSRDDLQRDLNFVWCGSTNSSTGVTGTRCFDEATQELSALGLKVAAFATYQYEENFSEVIMVCPKFDRKIESSRIYYRLVLSTTTQSDPCNITSGSSVVVLFTSFAGTDPHELLLESAAANNMSVYLGLPAVPRNYDNFGFDEELMPAYYAFTSRVLLDHKSRYSHRIGGEVNRWTFTRNHKSSKAMKTPLHGSKSLFDAIAGYYSTDESGLAQVDTKSIYLELYRNLGKAVHGVGKRFAISPFVDLNRSQLNATVDQHVQGFRNIVSTAEVDIVAVQEGRGAGKGCYYWPNQLDTPVVEVDSKLDEIIHYISPTLHPNVTYRDAFTASNQELFRQFGQIQDFSHQQGNQFEYWLNIEAFEYLRDDPCLLVDPMASGMGELLQRTTKSRIDRALTAAGASPKKIISFAWDSDFTCTTEQYKSSLEAEIRHDSSRPIIANCSFHSKNNLSVVVIGYNLEGETQGFVVEWTDRENKHHSDPLNGYYYETDWGQRHNKVESLIYIMLWDIPDMNQDLPAKGIVSVKANGAYHNCVFQYDYS